MPLTDIFAIVVINLLIIVIVSSGEGRGTCRVSIPTVSIDCARHSLLSCKHSSLHYLTLEPIRSSFKSVVGSDVIRCEPAATRWLPSWLVSSAVAFANLAGVV